MQAARNGILFIKRTYYLDSGEHRYRGALHNYITHRGGPRGVTLVGDGPEPVTALTTLQFIGRTLLTKNRRSCHIIEQTTLKGSKRIDTILPSSPLVLFCPLAIIQK